MRANRHIVLVGLAVFVGALSTCSLGGEGAIQQPISFDHKRHIDAKVKCLTCHEQAEDNAIASLPNLDACMSCHKEPQGKDPREAKVREYGQKGDEIPWIQVNHMPGHVYFSHAAHVTLGKLECKTCHGDMAQVTEPVTTPNVHLSMGACISCHTQKGVRNDCTTCHK